MATMIVSNNREFGILSFLFSLKMTHPAPDTNEICVEPTIKFAHDYHDESSTAAANLALEMQVMKPY